MGTIIGKTYFGNNVVFGLGNPPPSPFVGLLDTFPGATMAYSVRKLRSAYTGNALRVRRSSDNAEQDIGFVGADLDTSSLLSFVGAGNGFVTTWYDQSTSGINPVQATTTKQPKIVSSGVVETINGKPALLFDGVDDFMKTPTATTTLQMYSVHTSTNAIDSIPMGFASGPIDYSFGFVSNQVFMIANNAAIYGSIQNPYSASFRNQSVWFGDYTAFTLKRNNASTAFIMQVGTPPAPATNSRIIVGNRNLEDFSLDGTIQEQLYYPSSSNDTGITNNINAYFSVF